MTVRVSAYDTVVSVLLYLIIVVLLGLAVGRLAPLLFDGPDPVNTGRTLVLGACAAFIAGLFSWFVLGRHGWGLTISVGVSMLVVWLYLRSGPVVQRGPRPGESRGPRPTEYRGSRPTEYRGRAPRNRPPY